MSAIQERIELSRRQTAGAGDGGAISSPTDDQRRIHLGRRIAGRFRLRGDRSRGGTHGTEAAGPVAGLSQGCRALRGAERCSSSDLASIARCKAAGAYVIAFATAEGSLRTPQGPDLLIDSGSLPGLPTGHGICPLDTVTNVINLWVFTGEYVAACTRFGKTPTLYRSYGLEGAHERDAKYASQMFHNDMTVAPIFPGVLGNAYLDRISKILGKVQHDDIDDITQAGRWIAGSDEENTGASLSRTSSRTSSATRAAQPIVTMVGAKDPTPKKVVLIHISYQHPPQDLIEAAARAHAAVLLQRPSRRWRAGREHHLRQPPLAAGRCLRQSPRLRHTDPPRQRSRSGDDLLVTDRGILPRSLRLNINSV